jgi:hypothetical protein
MNDMKTLLYNERSDDSADRAASYVGFLNPSPSALEIGTVASMPIIARLHYVYCRA